MEMRWNKRTSIRVAEEEDEDEDEEGRRGGRRYIILYRQMVCRASRSFPMSSMTTTLHVEYVQRYTMYFDSLLQLPTILVAPSMAD
jgi:hypothetical protein